MNATRSTAAKARSLWGNPDITALKKLEADRARERDRKHTARAAEYDTAARALADGELDLAHSHSDPGPWHEAIRRETDRRYESARLEYAAIMADVNGYVRRQHATA